MLGAQASAGASTERALYDKLIAQQPAATIAAARQAGALNDTGSGKGGLKILLQSGVGFDMARAGCFTSTGDPDPACAGLVTQLVALARTPGTATQKTVPPTTPPIDADGDGQPDAPAPASTSSSWAPLVVLLAFLVFVVVAARKAFA
jgi:hypothetical protein